MIFEIFDIVAVYLFSDSRYDIAVYQSADSNVLKLGLPFIQCTTHINLLT